MSSETGRLRDLYPEIDPYDAGTLKVSEIHELYYEQCGRKDGKPVVFLHGGPGSGCGPRDRRFFDPNVYRIILFDQRGAGKSTPSAELRENTTWDLVSDIEKLRQHLCIEQWVVFGGSWGSTLALVYAETHPEAVKALILRGIFLGTSREDRWVYESTGAAQLFPEYFEEFVSLIPLAERRSLIDAYYRRLTCSDEETFVKYARAWNRWEMVLVKLELDEEALKKADEDEMWSLQHARTECHYFLHGLFLESENWILEHVDRIRHIPAVIIQGRYDLTCPLMGARDLHKRWPEADFHIVPDAGHSSKEAGIVHRLIEATDKFTKL